MNVTVIGCGRWGSFHAWYAETAGHNVMLYGRHGSKTLNNLIEKRKNEYLTLPPEIDLSDNLQTSLDHGEIVVIAVGAQNLRSLCREINSINTEQKTFVLCMKGIESETGNRLTQIFRQEITKDHYVAVWLGPGHVQDFVKSIPNCMVIGSEKIETTKFIIQSFSSDIIRFYIGQDLIGNEIGAAAKNVMGIAAGMLDGLGLSALKGALMARGTRELARLVRAMGGNELTIYGLCHLGDYEATLFSKHSNNRRFGEAFTSGDRFDKLAEGVATLKALRLLSSKHDVELPICDAIHKIVYDSCDPATILKELFLRPLKSEI